MNTNEISGKRQMEFLAEFDYIREAGSVGEEKAAEKWNLSVRRVQTICNEGMIEGAMKFGNTWAIPKNAVKPADKRIKSGKYIKS